MARTRLILLIVLAAASALLWVETRSPDTAPVVPGYVPIPPVNPHRLQVDEEGYYLPADEFRVSGFQFNGFSVHPEPMVIFSHVTDSIQHSSMSCERAVTSADTVHLACAYPGLGEVTVDGGFPTREAEDRTPRATFRRLCDYFDQGTHPLSQAA
ncbi:MAG TPA: hypothetical protein VM736_04615 [Gemmatimonadales bacterium]|nr:hypothetical protein [Gemmatimonadales bacterium]